MTIEDLYKIIEERKKSLPERSYVSSLFKDGSDRIIQKVGEEAVEVIIAAKNGKKERIIPETADLLFHLLVMLSYFEINPKEVLEELERRHNIKTG